jgi:hypothetical protein
LGSDSEIIASEQRPKFATQDKRLRGDVDASFLLETLETTSSACGPQQLTRVCRAAMSPDATQEVIRPVAALKRPVGPAATRRVACATIHVKHRFIKATLQGGHLAIARPLRHGRSPAVVSTTSTAGRTPRDPVDCIRDLALGMWRSGSRIDA